MPVLSFPGDLHDTASTLHGIGSLLHRHLVHCATYGEPTESPFPSSSNHRSARRHRYGVPAPRATKTAP
jgi:hypothetical protein